MIEQSKYELLNAGFYLGFEQKFYKDASYLIRGDTGKWSYSDVSLNGAGLHR
jgi:hypothetical protein